MLFNLSNVQYSSPDIKRKVSLPEKPSEDLAEFIGILSGDGYLYHNFNKYIIGIVGSPKTDRAYFQHVQMLIRKLFNIEAKIKEGGRGLRLVFNSKAVFHFLVLVCQMEYGKGKGERITIPKILLIEESFTNRVLRGIFDTDGTVFTSHKKGSPDYPCIELTTTSACLAKQVKRLLTEMDFRVAGVRKYRYKQGGLVSRKVSLYGKANALLWYKKIGFANPIKQEKLLKIINGDAGI